MYRSWTLIEPDTRDDGPQRGAQATLADPAFMLARQWQFGEFDAFDGGAPILADITYEHSAFHTAQDAKGRRLAGSTNAPFAATLAEPAHQRMALDAADAARHALRMGQLLETLVSDVARHEPKAPDAFAATVEKIGGWDRIEPTAMVRIAAIRRQRMPVDGVSILLALSRDDAAWPEGPHLREALRRMLIGLGLPVPAAPSDTDPAPDIVIGGGGGGGGFFDDFFGSIFDDIRNEVSDVIDALNATEVGSAGDAFDFAGLRHVATVSGDQGGGALMLESKPARPAWWSVTARNAPDTPVDESARAVPARLSFPGQPPTRFWQRQDTATDWQSADAGPTDLPRMIAGFAMSQVGPNGFVVPLTVPRGGHLVVSQITVTDAFGHRVNHRPAQKGPDLWQTLRHGSGAHLTDFLDAELLESDPIEVLALVPEDMSDRIWAVERKRPNASGSGVMVFESITPPAPPPDGAAPFYHMRQPPPASWMPMVWDEQAQAWIPRPVQEGPVPTDMIGILAGSLVPIPDGIVPRDGLELRRHWIAGRGRDGALVLWVARRMGPHSETRASGLAFDRLIAGTDRI